MKKPAYMKKKNVLKALGYDLTHWVRVVQYQSMFAYLAKIGPQNLEALEISGGDSSIWATQGGFKSIESPSYVDYDVCAGPIEGRSFDVIIADHVLPHVAWPFRMVKNIKAMLRPGGHFLISSSFLIRVNECPIDCTRWTADGLKHLLIEGGFSEASIHTGAWGNYDCVVTNLKRLGKKRGWSRSLENDPRYPVTSWACVRNDAIS